MCVICWKYSRTLLGFAIASLTLRGRGAASPEQKRDRRSDHMSSTEEFPFFVCWKNGNVTLTAGFNTYSKRFLKRVTRPRRKNSRLTIRNTIFHMEIMFFFNRKFSNFLLRRASLRTHLRYRKTGGFLAKGEYSSVKFM